jgi:uncharacterized protein YegP (UPF0339 family)
MANRPFPSFLIYVDQDSDFRWRIEAANGRVLGDSGEGYRNLADCEAAIALIRAIGANGVWETPAVTARRR